MRSPLVVLACVVMAACSGTPSGNSAPAETIVAVSDDERDVGVTSGELGGADATSPATTAVPSSPEPDRAVISVVTDDVEAELAGEWAETSDPFGTFVSCSGFRDVFAAYSVLVSDPAGDATSVSVVSADPVDAPGTYDAVVRVELASGSSIDARGTITIASGYQAGSFVAFGPLGASVEGTFACESDADPQPLAVGADDDTLEAVEVVAQLRRGGQERLLGLAAPAGGAASLSCAGAAGGDGDPSLLVRADGGSAMGAITTFELGGVESPGLRLRVGGASYEFSDVELIDGGSEAAGSFSAEADGVSIDGAFRCT